MGSFTCHVDHLQLYDRCIYAMVTCFFVVNLQLIFLRLFARIVKIQITVSNYEIILIMLVDLAEIVYLQL